MDFEAARHNMVESQIRTNQVTDPRIIDAMAEIPREVFVPEARKGVAYVDEALPIGGGRHLMEPMVLARLIQVAEVGTGDVVLDVGCASGYSAAVLARLATTVVALECDPALAARATSVLAELGIDGAAVVEGPLEDGYSGQGPYDAIFFGGGIADVPPAIADQLAEGGRMVAVIGGDERTPGRGTLITRLGGRLSRRDIFDCGTPPLPGFAPEPAFVF